MLGFHRRKRCRTPCLASLRDRWVALETEDQRRRRNPRSDGPFADTQLRTSMFVAVISAAR